MRDIIPMLQPASALPLVLRQIPIWKNNIVTGFVDLALERAYLYHEHEASTIIDLPEELAGREEEARFNMLEQLADYDDELMEQLAGRHRSARRTRFSMTFPMICVRVRFVLC